VSLEGVLGLLLSACYSHIEPSALRGGRCPGAGMRPRGRTKTRERGPPRSPPIPTRRRMTTLTIPTCTFGICSLYRLQRPHLWCARHTTVLKMTGLILAYRETQYKKDYRLPIRMKAQRWAEPFMLTATLRLPDSHAPWLSSRGIGPARPPLGGGSHHSRNGGYYLFEYVMSHGDVGVWLWGLHTVRIYTTSEAITWSQEAPVDVHVPLPTCN